MSVSRPATKKASRISFPASDEAVIAVGACNDRGRRSRYSNYGPGLTLVAPSSDDHRPGITTTDVNLRGKGYSSGAYCDDFSGTSAATPLAAGIAALTLSANRSLAWKDVREILTSTAEKIDSAKGDVFARLQPGIWLWSGQCRSGGRQSVEKKDTQEEDSNASLKRPEI